MHVQPAAIVVTVFGGVRRTARLLGIDPATVRKWGDGVDGHIPGLIPSRHQVTILDLAAKHGLTLTAEDLIRGRELATV